MPKTTPQKERKPFVDFRNIRSRITMEQVLEHYNLLHTFKRSGHSLSGPCPIHKGTNKTQFRVETEKNIWNCFSECKHGGNTLDFIAKMEGIQIHDAALKACEWFGISVDEVKTNGKANVEAGDAAEEKSPPSAKEQSKPASNGVHAPAPEDNAPNAPLKFNLNNKLQREHPYLTQERGLTLETIIDFGLGYFTGDKGLMVGRAVIPILNVKNELVAYAGRWPGEPPEGTEKYKLPPNFKKLLEVFNLHRAIHEPEEQPLVIVEGFFDVIKLHQLGCRKTVALMGWFMSPQQEELIRQHVKASHIIVMLDENKAAQDAREQIAGRLAKFAFVKVHVFDEPEMQPEHLSADEVKQIVGGAT
jgi:DNA primase